MWYQHHDLPSFLQQHDSTPEELHEELFERISGGDDVKVVASYLCRCTPLDPLGGRSMSALKLAVITDRSRTVSLLLASGVSLSASLLQQAWSSSDVSPGVLATLTTVSITASLSRNVGTPLRV